MNNSYIIKTCTSNEIEKIECIEKLCFNEDYWNRKSIEDCFTNPVSIVYGCFQNDELIAYSVIYIVADEAEILKVAVLPEKQGKGIAFSFMSSILSNIDSTVASYYLEVRESNFKAINLYKKLGFTRTGVRVNYYHKPRENAILMQK